MNSISNFFLRLKGEILRNSKSVVIKPSAKVFKDVELILKKLQQLNLITEVRKIDSASLFVVFSLDNESKTSIQKIIVVPKKISITSVKLIKKFLKEYPYAIGFIRTSSGIYTFEESVNLNCGGEVLAVID